MSTMIHPLADVQSQSIGDGTRVWQFVVILPEAVIGKDCIICANALVENRVVVGDRVTIKSGVQLWDGVQLEDDVFVGPNVTFCQRQVPALQGLPGAIPDDDRTARGIDRRERDHPARADHRRKAMIGAGSVVSHSVPANGIVVGDPGRIVGYVDADKKADAYFFGDTRKGNQPTVAATRVNGVSLYHFPVVTDLRGNLTVGNFGQEMPFKPKR